MPSTGFRQTILTRAPKEITLHRAVAHDSYIDNLLDYLHSEVIGLSYSLDKWGKISSIALATTTDVVLIHTTATSRPQSRLARLFGGEVTLVSFSMAKTALFINRDLRYAVQGIDLSTVFSKSGTTAMTPARVVKEELLQDNVHQVRALFTDDEGNNIRLRAWVAACVASESIPEITNARQVRTTSLTPEELRVCAEIASQADLLYLAKPTSLENDFNEVRSTEDGLEIKNARYKTRVRRNEETHVVIQTERGQVIGLPARANGRTTELRPIRGQLHGTIQSIRVIGREDLTIAERARDEFILLALRNEVFIRRSIFVRLLWFPLRLELDMLQESPLQRMTPRVGLNLSQSRVVDAIKDPSIPLVVVQGPPGSGKTSTIAHAVKECDARGNSIWIAAQSNVAVKNIAEKLFKTDIEFRILVSKEFHFEWHEHIYTDIEHSLIRSDDLFPDRTATERRFLDCNVVLCTLSMLSNPVLLDAFVFRTVPVEVLIIDEASQINISDYMHLFAKFAREDTLKKVCMFGDPQQLPPYGLEDAPTIKSIFEVPHLAKVPYFLDTQYRMPTPLGKFISAEVYENRLKSVHAIKQSSCVRFVDVNRGRGEENIGQSWRNRSEVETIGHLMEHYYRGKDVCIITPYDPQRAAIAQHLKSEGLPWECVFNVDSFQGNEADYVIVSVVRTTSAGFLKSLQRMNVMLTRCKKGMVIVTNRNFIQNGGRNTLLGRLAEHWSYNPDDAWTNWNAVMNKAVDLPGAPLWSGMRDDIDGLASGMVALSVADDEPAQPLLGLVRLSRRSHMRGLSGDRAPINSVAPLPNLSTAAFEEAFPTLGETVAPKAPAGVWGRKVQTQPKPITTWRPHKRS